MPAYIHHIETLVPEHAYPQAEAEVRMRGWLAGTGGRAERLAGRVYRNSGIDTRHSVLGDFAPGAQAPLFVTGADGRLVEPGTRARNDRYAAASRQLAVTVAGRALAACPDLAPADVTHVVTVTCTGFANPGADYHIVRDCGLHPSTQRYVLGFMGCYAALPALRMAAQFCAADPAATVLVVSVELCSLHLHLSGGMEALVANAIFADGCAAAIVRGCPPRGPTACRLDGFASDLIPAGEADMAWRIGDQGFEITLSSYVPDLIGANVRELVTRALGRFGLSPGQIDRWAVHPGGKAILDRVEAQLALTPAQLAGPRRVLRRYGNMSSATSLFVLRDLLDTPAPGDDCETVCALAFGPGLTVELALLTLAGRRAPGN